MGIYLNPGNKGFRESIQSAIYVDKTELIDKLNVVLDTRQNVAVNYDKNTKRHSCEIEKLEISKSKE